MTLRLKYSGLVISSALVLVLGIQAARSQDAVPETSGSPASALPSAPSTAAPSGAGADTVLGTTADAVPANAGPLPAEVLILNKIEEELKEKYKNDIYVPPSIPSLIFTPEQQSLLREARNGFNTRIPKDIEENTPSLEEPKLNTQARKLTLSGIVFINPDDWTIWLNNKRINSTNMPTEAVDLRVYKEFIEIRWFDAQTNQIYPIRLRPNQSFNLDAHTFVPG